MTSNAELLAGLQARRAEVLQEIEQAEQAPTLDWQKLLELRIKLNETNASIAALQETMKWESK